MCCVGDGLGRMKVAKGRSREIYSRQIILEQRDEPLPLTWLSVMGNLKEDGAI